MRAVDGPADDVGVAGCAKPLQTIAVAVVRDDPVKVALSLVAARAPFNSHALAATRRNLI